MLKDIKYIVCISKSLKHLHSIKEIELSFGKKKEKKINFSQNWQQRNKCLSSMQKTYIEDPRQKSDE